MTGITLDLALCEEHCEACIFTRATWQSVPKFRVSPQSQQFGDEIHTDMWGPAPVSTRRRQRYFITFMDNMTRFTLTYLLVAKSDVLSHYCQFEAWVKTQNHCVTIKVLRSNHGSKYLSGEFDKHLAATSTAH